MSGWAKRVGIIHTNSRDWTHNVISTKDRNDVDAGTEMSVNMHIPDLSTMEDIKDLGKLIT